MNVVHPAHSSSARSAALRLIYTTPTLSPGWVPTSLLKAGFLGIRAQNTMLRLPLDIILDRGLVWHGAVFHPGLKLTEEPVRLSRHTTETVPHSGDFVISVKVLDIWKKSAHFVVVLFCPDWGDDVIGLSVLTEEQC